MSTLQEHLLRESAKADDKDQASRRADPDNPTGTRELVKWLTENCQAVNAPMGQDSNAETMPWTITFHDGTAVTVVEHEETTTMEIHRGKFNDYERTGWTNLHTGHGHSRAFAEAIRNLRVITSKPSREGDRR